MAIVATFNGGVVAAAAAGDDPTRDPEDDVRLSCCCEASPGPEEDEDEGGCLEVIVSEIDTKKRSEGDKPRRQRTSISGLSSQSP